MIQHFHVALFFVCNFSNLMFSISLKSQNFSSDTFRVVIWNKTQNSAWTNTVISAVACVAVCGSTKQCVAVNIVPRGESLECKILSSLGGDLIEHPGAKILVAEKYIKTCATATCENNATCRDIQPEMKDLLKAFSCVCPCGYCGVYCEKLNYWSQRGVAIAEHNIPFPSYIQFDGSTDACIEVCLHTPGCQSADFSTKDSTCLLNDVNRDMEELSNFKGFIYLEPSCICN
ncbi:uncharacterized protein LOC143226712 [Tachypleus tridentatus]|uniref:uncharacterized protein LOC143226712 n=1 Tax=Tachypleus tridentatus TaxID=6853 RepID=UPI003FD57893